MVSRISSLILSSNCVRGLPIFLINWSSYIPVSEDNTNNDNMGKDKSLLSAVSKCFTEDTLENILREVTGENEVKILSWDFGDASQKGDGYLSVLNRIKVVGEAGSKPAEISLVVKSMPQNLGTRKTFRSTEFFYNEVTCYTVIFPKLKEFLKSKGQESLIVVPCCFAALTDGENDFVALEDVSISGFGPVARQSTLSLSECTVILKALAKFHAGSFAYKDQNKVEFQKLADKMLETYFTPKLYETWYKTFQTRVIEVAKDALAKEYPDSEAEKCFNSWSGPDLYNKSIEFCSRTGAPTSVVTHGDTWAPNFLIRRSSGDNVTALALDFQLARCSSPVLDVAFFIYCCTEKALRDDHYHEMLKIYHDELHRSISLLGSNPNKLYPWDVFINEVQEQSVHGINSALEAIPGALLDPSEAYDVDSITGDDAVDISKIWDVSPIKSKEGRRRLADVIVHAVENNYM